MNQFKKQHVKKIGLQKYSRAYALARFEVRQDRRLVGLDKIRKAIAEEAALRGTGFPRRPFILPRNTGRPSEEMQRIAEEVLRMATVSVSTHRWDDFE